MGVGNAIARSTSRIVERPLINAPSKAIAVIGLLLRRINGFKAAVKIPRIIVMKYLGYLETLEKNSPMLISSKSI